MHFSLHQFSVYKLGFRVWGLGFGALYLRFRIHDNFKIGGQLGLGFRVSGLGFRVEEL